MPYEFGAQGSCQDSGFASALGPWMPDDDAASCGDTSAGGGGAGCAASASKELLWMPNGGDRTMAFTAWLSAPPGTPGSVGLYVGAHDPAGRLKMLPVGCLGSSAGLRAIHFPQSFNDASTDNFTIPYDIVVAAYPCGTRLSSTATGRWSTRTGRERGSYQRELTYRAGCWRPRSGSGSRQAATNLRMQRTHSLMASGKL